MPLIKNPVIKKTHNISKEYVSNNKCMDIAKLALSCLDKNIGNSELCKNQITGVRLCRLEYIEKNKKNNKKMVKIKY
jgi:hypothetical protein